MIACSGTVTLEAGIAGVPGLVIIIYRWPTGYLRNGLRRRHLYCRILF